MFDGRFGADVDVSADALSDSALMNLSTTRTSFVVDGLMPNTAYLIALRSVNKLGWSQSTDTLTVLTQGRADVSRSSPRVGIRRRFANSGSLQTAKPEAVPHSLRSASCGRVFFERFISRQIFTFSRRTSTKANESRTLDCRGSWPLLVR